VGLLETPCLAQFCLDDLTELGLLGPFSFAPHAPAASAGTMILEASYAVALIFEAMVCNAPITIDLSLPSVET
jgi:hypothetical protein